MIVVRLAKLLPALLAVALARPAAAEPAPLIWYNAGSSLSTAASVDCGFSGINCAKTGTQIRLTVPKGAGGVFADSPLTGIGTGGSHLACATCVVTGGDMPTTTTVGLITGNARLGLASSGNLTTTSVAATGGTPAVNSPLITMGNSFWSTSARAGSLILKGVPQGYDTGGGFVTGYLDIASGGTNHIQIGTQNLAPNLNIDVISSLSTTELSFNVPSGALGFTAATGVSFSVGFGQAGAPAYTFGYDTGAACPGDPSCYVGTSKPVLALSEASTSSIPFAIWVTAEGADGNHPGTSMLPYSSIGGNAATATAVIGSGSPKAGAVARCDSNQASLSGILITCDGTLLGTVGMRVLLGAQSTAAQNGLWVVAAGAWTRPTDFATGTEQEGAFVCVEQGTLYKGFCYQAQAVAPNDVVGTNDPLFVQVNGAYGITAGSGLSKSGNALSVATVGVTNAMLAGSIDLTAKVTGTLPSANGGSGVASPTAHAFMLAEGASAMTPLLCTTGTAPWGVTGSDPTCRAVNPATDFGANQIAYSGVDYAATQTALTFADSRSTGTRNATTHSCTQTGARIRYDGSAGAKTFRVRVWDTTNSTAQTIDSGNAYMDQAVSAAATYTLTFGTPLSLVTFRPYITSAFQTTAGGFYINSAPPWPVGYVGPNVVQSYPYCYSNVAAGDVFPNNCSTTLSAIVEPVITCP